MQRPLARTMIVGSHGFIGSHLAKAYTQISPTTICTHHTPYIGECKLDLHKLEFSELPLEKVDTLILAAGLSSVAYCEKRPQKSYLCNVTAPLALIKICKQREIFPIVFSSDYVFDGKHGSYTESSPLHPLNAYGLQKQALEKQVMDLCEGNCLILRLSKIYDRKQNTKCFLEEIVQSLISGKKVRAASDQIFCPLALQDLVQVIIKLQVSGIRGLFHLCGKTPLSRLAIARQVQKHLGCSSLLIEEIFLKQLKEPFKRPENTSMLCAKLCTQIFYEFGDFFEDVKQRVKSTMQKSMINTI